jgi:hypothetical protein
MLLHKKLLRMTFSTTLVYATGHELDGWFDSWQEQEIFLFSTVSRLDLWPIQPPIQWVQGAFSWGVK